MGGPVLVNQKVLKVPISSEDIQRLSEILDSTALLLKAHLLCEQLVEHFIERTLSRDVLEAIDIQFAKKLKLAERLGMPAGVVQCLAKLNQLRNKAAHRHRFEISESDVVDLKNFANSSYSTSVLNITDATRFKFDGAISVADHTTPISIDVTYGAAKLREKLLIVLCMFLGKLLNFLSACDEIWQALDAAGQDRVGYTELNIKKISVTAPKPQATDSC